jgi:hypothetical protein
MTLVGRTSNELRWGRYQRFNLPAPPNGLAETLGVTLYEPGSGRQARPGGWTAERRPWPTQPQHPILRSSLALEAFDGSVRQARAPYC